MEISLLTLKEREKTRYFKDTARLVGSWGGQIGMWIRKLLSLEEEYWKTWFQADWLMKGDRNIAYFYQKASQRHKRNFICSVTNSNGIAITDLTGMIHKVLNEDDISLERQYTSDDVAKALKEMKGIKITEPDWNVLGPKVINMALGIFMMIRILVP